MKCHILQILLYPKEKIWSPRALMFSLEKINVITGTSQRGKSAIGKILDYCLTSSTCQIPKGPIRSSVEWYAVGLQLNEEYLFIARKTPDDNGASREFYYEAGLHAFTPLPVYLKKNTSFDRVKQILNEKFGLAKIPVGGNEASQKSFGGSMGFRDLVAFNYLPQHIVANPQTLFYRTDDSIYFERLKKVFPLAIGAISQDSLLAELQYQELQKEIKSLKDKIIARQEAAGTWQEEAEVYFLKAVDLGLVPEEDYVSDSDSYSEKLKSIKEKYDAFERPSPVGMAARYTEHLVYTRRRMEKLERKRQTLKRRLQKTEILSNTAEEYKNSLATQQQRVSIAEKLVELSEYTACPMCGTETYSAKEKLEDLAKESVSLNHGVSQADNVRKVHLLNVSNTARKELNLVEKNIWKLQNHLGKLEEYREDVKSYQDREREAARLIGKIEQLLDAITDSNVILDMNERLKQIQNDADEIRDKYDFKQKGKKTKMLLAQVCENTSRYAESLGLEWFNSNPTIDPAHLTLNFESQESRQSKTYLSELGSGENWMGYHIAVFLSLHGLFSRQGQVCPVPSFLLIDQPTQVYFPAKTNAYDHRSVMNLDSDMEKAKNIFRLLYEVVNEMTEPPQIIVTEHADRDTWGEFEINEVANWRDDSDGEYTALIPKEWL